MTLTAPPQNALAAGLAALDHDDLDAAHHALTRAAELDPADPSPWVGLARVAERRGDFAATLAHTLHAVHLDPRQAPVLVAVGRGLQSLDRLDDAERAYRGAGEAQPLLADAWHALAALLLARQQPKRAMQALEQALQIAPGVSELHALAGDILLAGNIPGGAAKAYAQALAIFPKSAVVMNKLGCVRRQLGDLAGADATLRDAVALDPTAREARENLVSLYIEMQRVADARTVLRDAFKVSELGDEARRNAAAVLAIFAEHDRLAPAIAQAVADGSDAALVPLISATPDNALALDQPRVAVLRSLTMKTGGPLRDRENARFARGLPDWAGWPAFEAHFALHGGDSVDASLATVMQFAGHSAEARADIAPAPRKLRHFVRAIALRRTLAPPAATPAGAEARLRFWHAVITQDDSDVFPGQVKPIPNLVSSNPGVIRTPLDAVAGTWRSMLSEHRNRAQPGPWRAALLYFAIVDIHGFRNANGRLARFMVNVELEAAGYHPIVQSAHTIKSIAAALSAVRHLDDLEPLVDLFARAGDETMQFLASIKARDTAALNVHAPRLPPLPLRASP